MQLHGHAFDLSDWTDALREPFDPVVLEDPKETFLLKSHEFGEAANAEDVREKALALVARLNGAMAVTHSTRPISLGAILHVDDHGTRHSHVFAELVGAELRLWGRATAEVLGPDGKPLPPPSPSRSVAQSWNDMAATDDDIADLLEQHGKASGWYEIYKTIELAEVLMGRKNGTRKLAKILGASAGDFHNMRQTANYYRHAREQRPTTPMALAEAKPLLKHVVRTVLEWRQNGDQSSAS